jgi:acyl carrier protein
MTNIEKYNKAFVDVFAINATLLDDNFSKETVGEWDSVHQLNIVANIEEAFDIMLEPEDIMDFISYQAGKMILEKYDIIL